MNQYIKLVILLGILCMGCTQNDELGSNPNTGRDICITASLPVDGPATKAEKQTFNDEDIIHISAEFTASTTLPAQYACLEWSDTENKWKTRDNTTLTWPEGATAASFTAYYFPSISALDNKQNRGQSFPIATFTDANGNDPLKATVTTSSGAAVHLQFEHLLTKLTLTKLIDADKKDIADGTELWASKTDIKNIFNLKIQDNKLSHEFTTVNDTVSSKEVKDGSVVLLLAPGDYENMKLTFKNYKPYQSFPIEKLMNLEAGKHYTLDITNLPGNSVSGELKEEEYWNDRPTFNGILTEIQIGEFLDSIKYNSSYSIGKTKILDVYVKDDKSTVTLLRSVDFGNNAFTPVSLDNRITFEGNYHTIKNIKITKAIDDGAALFGKMEGTIQNLALENVTTDGITNVKHVGVLVGHSLGTLTNIQLKGTNSISATSPTYIGGVAGLTEAVSKVTVSGELTVEANGEATDNICIGGLIGQADGIISESAIHATATVTNNCTGTKFLYVGGFAGSSSKEMTDCSTAATVTSASASGNGIYIGGLAGQAQGVVDKCSASGDVIGGQASTVDTEPGVSYTGGCIGNFRNGSLKASQAVGSVTDGTATGSGALAASGGFVGCLNVTSSAASDVSLVNCFSVGRVSAAATNGGFIGKAEKGVGAAKNIIIHNSFSISVPTFFIGSGTDATVTNCHYNGTDEGVTGSNSLLENLNAGKGDGFSWVVTLGLYKNYPYLTGTK